MNIKYIRNYILLKIFFLFYSFNRVFVLNINTKTHKLFIYINIITCNIIILLKIRLF